MRQRTLMGWLPAALVLVVAGTAAAGDKELREAKRHHDRGVQHYNIGRWDSAIEEFEKAYELDPDPTLLFNLAKAHNQKGDAERAIFFYRRYLQMAPEAPDREQVLKKVAELERSRRPAEPAPLPPPPPPPAAAPSPSVPMATSLPQPSAPLAAPPTLLPEPVVTAEAEEVEEGPALRLSFAGGAAFPRFSGRDLEVPVLASLRVNVTAALPAGGGVVDLGGALALVPVPYRRVDLPASAAEVRSYLVGLYGSAGYRVPLPGNFSLGGEADVGVTAWSGIGDGNPFTIGSVPGTQAMPTFRLAAALLYRVSRPLWLWAGPAYQLAVPVNATLKDAVSAVHLIELSAGLAVQP